MTSANSITYISYGNKIIAYKRGREINRIENDTSFNIFQLIAIGPLISGLCDDNTLKIWDMTKGELYTEIEFGNDFTASAMIHPSTYLNKLLIASTQGTMQIWNIRTNNMIYQFKSFGSPISCLVQSPVIDVAAIGLLDGTVLLYNIKMDEKIDSIRQDDRVTAISFRTDEEQMMATANMHGDVALWDLNQRKLVHIMKGAHDGIISSLSFLNGQPILVTAGADNSVKQWIFEKENVVPKVLKSRSGHYSPPSKIRYYGNDGHFILSTGRDQSLRMFSVYRDNQSFELSQGQLEKKAKARDVRTQELKLPLVTDFAASPAKVKQWDNILTSHINDIAGRTWSLKNKAIGNHTFLSLSKTAVKVTEISACGNFGFLGCSSGQIDMFNMQSGGHRKSFGGTEGHQKPITGLATDNISRYLISSSVDRTIKIWNMKKGDLIHSITLESPIVAIRFLRDNELLAVVCDDLGIRVIDIQTYKVVREFWGHRNRITDLTFSPDGRWLVSSSLDATVRTWDLPTGTMVDIFKVDNVVTSLTFSPTGEFLATAHVDNVGIFLWANRTQFSNISLRSIADDEEVQLLSLPSLATVDSDDEDSIDDDISESEINIKDESITEEQLTKDMITLSLEPRSKWQNLLNLEIIKSRNKPKEAPKAPEQTPFFLPTVAGAKPTFLLDNDDQMTTNQNDKTLSKRILDDILVTETEFSRLLRTGHENNNDYADFVSYTKSLNPSGLDVELRTLTIDSELTYINLFVESIYYMLKTRKNFELAQSWLNVFLSIHGDLIISNPENDIHNKLKNILTIQQDEFSRLSEKIYYGLCVIDFARKA
ncbi:unnamed protein product [Cunninghamella echinulata]